MLGLGGYQWQTVATFPILSTEIMDFMALKLGNREHFSTDLLVNQDYGTFVPVNLGSQVLQWDRPKSYCHFIHNNLERKLSTTHGGKRRLNLQSRSSFCFSIISIFQMSEG